MPIWLPSVPEVLLSTQLKVRRAGAIGMCMCRPTMRSGAPRLSWKACVVTMLLWSNACAMCKATHLEAAAVAVQVSLCLPLAWQEAFLS